LEVMLVKQLPREVRKASKKRLRKKMLLRRAKCKHSMNHIEILIIKVEMKVMKKTRKMMRVTDTDRKLGANNNDHICSNLNIISVLGL